MARNPEQSYWDVYPHKLYLFNARKNANESLAQWAARLTQLGESSGWEDITLLDMLLRDIFVTGLDPGPIRDFFEPRADVYQMTFKQVLDLAFAMATQFEMEAKAAEAKALQEENDKKTT